MDRSRRPRLASGQHAHPLRREGEAARRAAHARSPCRGLAHDRCQHPETVGPRVRYQQVPDRDAHGILIGPPLCPVRRGEPAQLRGVGAGVRAHHAAEHPQRRRSCQPRPADRLVRPRLPSTQLRLRRCPQAGRNRDLVSQRSGYGGARGSSAGQARRLQPVRPLLD